MIMADPVVKANGQRLQINTAMVERAKRQVEITNVLQMTSERFDATNSYGGTMDPIIKASMPEVLNAINGDNPKMISAVVMRAPTHEECHEMENKINIAQVNREKRKSEFKEAVKKVLPNKDDETVREMCTYLSYKDDTADGSALVPNLGVNILSKEGGSLVTKAAAACKVIFEQLNNLTPVDADLFNDGLISLKKLGRTGEGILKIEGESKGLRSFRQVASGPTALDPEEYCFPVGFMGEVVIKIFSIYRDIQGTLNGQDRNLAHGMGDLIPFVLRYIRNSLYISSYLLAGRELFVDFDKYILGRDETVQNFTHAYRRLARQAMVDNGMNTHSAPSLENNYIGTTVLSLLWERAHLLNEIAFMLQGKTAPNEYAVKKGTCGVNRLSSRLEQADYTPLVSSLIAIRQLSLTSHTHGDINGPEFDKWNMIWRVSTKAGFRSDYIATRENYLSQLIINGGMNASMSGNCLIGWIPSAKGMSEIYKRASKNPNSHVQYKDIAETYGTTMKMGAKDVIRGLHPGNSSGGTPGSYSLYECFGSSSIGPNSHIFKQAMRGSSHGTPLTRAIGNLGLGLFLPMDKEVSLSPAIEFGVTTGDKFITKGACTYAEKVMISGLGSRGDLSQGGRLLNLGFNTQLKSIEDGARVSLERGSHGALGDLNLELTVGAKDLEATNTVMADFGEFQEAAYNELEDEDSSAASVKMIVGFKGCRYRATDKDVVLNLKEKGILEKPLSGTNHALRVIDKDKGILYRYALNKTTTQGSNALEVKLAVSEREVASLTPEDPYLKTIISNVKKSRPAVLSIPNALISTLHQQYTDELKGKVEDNGFANWVRDKNTAISVSNSINYEGDTTDALYSSQVGLYMVPKTDELGSGYSIPMLHDGQVVSTDEQFSNITYDEFGYTLKSLALDPKLLARAKRSVKKHVSSVEFAPLINILDTIHDGRVLHGNAGYYPILRYSGWTLQKIIPAITGIFDARSQDQGVETAKQWLAEFTQSCRRTVIGHILVNNTDLTTALSNVLTSSTKDFASTFRAVNPIHTIEALEMIISQNFGTLRQKDEGSIDLFQKDTMSFRGSDDPLCFYWILLGLSLTSTRVVLTPKERGDLGRNVRDGMVSEARSASVLKRNSTISNSRRNIKAMLKAPSMGLGETKYSASVTGTVVYHTRVVDYLTLGKQPAAHPGSVYKILRPVGATGNAWEQYKNIIANNSDRDAQIFLEERIPVTAGYRQYKRVLSAPTVGLAHKNIQRLLKYGNCGGEYTTLAMGTELDCFHVRSEKGMLILCDHAIKEAAVSISAESREGFEYTFRQPGATVVAARGKACTCVMVEPRERMSGIFSKFSTSGQAGVTRRGNAAQSGRVRIQNRRKPPPLHL
jgi:hypothetical protein